MAPEILRRYPRRRRVCLCLKNTSRLHELQSFAGIPSESIQEGG